MYKLKWSALMGALIVVCICGCGRNTADFFESEANSMEENAIAEDDVTLETSKEEAMEETKREICIYVCGAVLNPGVYTLEEGSRVCDAFSIAGGLTADAADDYWNQARVLNDGEMLYVPTKAEAEERNLTPQTNTGNPNTEHSDGKININTATKEELMTIPGIGETRADSILAYRSEHGEFSGIEAIMEVSGIKEGLYEKIKDYIKTD